MGFSKVNKVISVLWFVFTTVVLILSSLLVLMV
jgi:hypothetical protein